jgi:probable HAF family extracellular repeat protein
VDGGRALCLELPTLSRAASDSFTTIDQPGASDTYLYGINDIGGIVGAFPGFQYENGVFTDIPAPRPSDINNAGQIVGSYTGTNGNAAFLYSEGVFTSLPGSVASGINDAGQIVGFTQTIGNSETPGETHGYLYSNGALTTIDFPGAGVTTPSSINNVGQIAGTFRYPGATGYIHGFVESNGVFTIVDEPGFVDAYLNGTIISGINDSGDIVGWIVKGGGGCSFIYHEGSFTCFSVPGGSSLTPTASIMRVRLSESMGFQWTRRTAFSRRRFPNRPQFRTRARCYSSPGVWLLWSA